MADEARKGAGFELIWAVWNRRKWLAILLFAAPVSAVVSLVTFLPNIYRSTATVLVERQQVPETFVRATVTSGLETRLHTISQEILSRSRLEGLITRFGLYPDLREQTSPEAVIERMRRDIKLDLKAVAAEGRGGATIAFSLSYLGSDPQTVALVTNTLASFYIEENLKVRERQAAGTAEFLRVQLQEVKQRLDEQERRVSEFKKRYIGELPQQMQANLATLEGLNVQLRLNSDNQIRAMDRREALAKQLAEADSFGSGGGPDATAARIARLSQELTQLRTLFSDKYPDVIRLKAEIAALESQLAEKKLDGKQEENTPGFPTSPYVLQIKQGRSEVEAEIKGLKREEQRLRDAIATYQRRVEGTPQREQEFQEMSRDYETTTQLYRSLLTRYEEAQIAESMEQRQKGEQFRILDPAIASQQPAAPDRIRLILMGFLLSLGLAAGAVMLAEQLDTSFHTVDDLRTFATVPVLVSIPKIVTGADVSRRRWRFRLAAAVAMLSLGLIIGVSYLVAQGSVPLVGPLARSLLLRV
ncbi:MAG: hypothetical protein L0191_16380 [Acidobacteria bacterium]|nr:hypothetical protein [Acidobacteriota bacterium]